MLSSEDRERTRKLFERQLSRGPARFYERWLRAAFGQRMFAVYINEVQDPSRARVIRNLPERMLDKVVAQAVEKHWNIEIERER